jgi:hypothetical protein
VSIDNLFAFLPFAKLSAQNMGLALGFMLCKAQSEHYHEWKNLPTFFYSIVVGQLTMCNMHGI